MKNYKGLNENEVLDSRKSHGRNVLTPPAKTPWYKLFLEKFEDPIIIILLVAAVISFIVGLFEGSFIESIGIVVAIGLATGVGFWMEYSAKKKFDILNQLSDSESVKVIRNSEVVEIPKTDLVVGDIVILATGDEIPADIELYEALELKVDESTMTGESVAAGKRAKKEGEVWNESGFAPYLVLRSTKITEGSGVGVVVAVGDETNIGKTTRAAMEETELETPLNKQLGWLGSWINRAAFAIAILLLIFLNVTHSWGDVTGWLDIVKVEIRFMMIALALIICAVPEGLPLASMLSLAFAMKTMAKENNLIKKMHACETIGCVNIICSDKTGTLTQNKMSVVDTDIKNIGNVILNALVNSSANLDKNGETIGNPTEGAMLKYFLGAHDYKTYREQTEIISQKPFNSTDKYMSTVVKKDGKEIVLLKGAPEVVAKLIGDDSFLENVTKQQERGRRAISLVSGANMEQLKYDGTLFIEDPVREDVPGAVKKCYEAGIDVVMMTGDNVKTAKEIANQAGFNRKIQGQNEENWAIEAKDFFNVAWKDGKGYPNVIARCKPEDKLAILKAFQEKDKGTDKEHILAMTGDGVNDSPSLNHANVGIAMGSGTSVAKEASDIVLLDDAFPSIVTGIKWARSLYKNIQSFLTYQLIINVAVCLTALFAPILGQDLPFNVLFLLYINICMDSIGALCLASEPADERVLKDKPRKQTEFILTPDMLKVIFGIGALVFIGLSILTWDMNHQNFIPFIDTDNTLIFAIFMMFNFYNLFNIRVYRKNCSIFYNISKSSKFLIGAAVVLIGTIGIIQFGGEVFQTHPLDLKTWCIIIASTSLTVIIKEVWYQITKR